jgi:hypothetical protein
MWRRSSRIDTRGKATELKRSASRLKLLEGERGGWRWGCGVVGKHIPSGAEGGGGGQWWRRGGDLHERERDLFFRTTNLDTGGADGENAEEDHGSAFDDRGSGEVGQRY